MKTETFNTIPSQVKVDLFDNIVKTAFPNFDNLLVASWNVVSVYANVGSDFPELHRAVVELKGALEGFEGAYSPRLKSNAKGRKEAIPGQQNQSRTSTPVPRFVISTPVPASRSSPTPAVQTGEDNATAQRFQDDSDDLQHQMLPPRTPQIHQQHPEEDVKHVDHQPEPHPSTSNDHTALHQSAPPEHHPADPDPNSNLSSPVEQHPPPPHELAHKNRSRSASSRGSPAIPGSELLRKRQEYASSITKANRSSTGAALGQQYPQQGEYGEESEHAQDQHAQDKPVTTQDPRRPQGNFGNSVLGVKKAGAAPAAPMMMHGRKEGGGGGKSDGGGRRG